MHLAKLGLALLSATLVAAAPVDRSSQTPDFTQTDPAAGFPRDGGSYCGPVATSNALLYLAAVGFDRLRPSGEADEKTTQVKLIKSVASEPYMGTSESAGTSIPGLFKGLRKFVDDAGYKVARYEHQGWRSNPKDFPRLSDIPTADFIRAGLAEPRSAVLLNIGWYKLDAATQTYARVGGHWITVVGADDQGNLLVHDPSPRSPKGATETLKVTPVSGRLRWEPSGSAKPAERDAKGFFHLAGIRARPTSDVGIVDHAVVLVLAAPTPPPSTRAAPTTAPALQGKP